MILRLACFLVAAFASFSLHATIITGSFAGNVSRVLTPSGDGTSGLGDPVAGSFFLDTRYFSFAGTDESSYAEYFVFNVDPAVRSMELRFDYGDGPVVQRLGAQTVRLTRKDHLDTLYLSDYFPGGYGASVTLVADAGTLFDSFGIDSILGGADFHLPRSRAYTGSYLEDAGNAGSIIALTSAGIRIGEVAEVPEPGSLAMVKLGLGIGAAWQLRRRRAA